MVSELTGPPSSNPSTKLIAPIWHTVVLIIFLFVPVISGILLQKRQTPGNQIFSNHSVVMLRFYVPVLILEWFLVLFVWAGIRRSGTTLNALIGGRWDNWKKIAVDLGLALAVWIIMMGIGSLSSFLPPENAKGTNVILPQGRLEYLIWIAISGTAGFVEELVYRGYLQTQFARMGLPTILAVIAQSAIFALGHIYEGRNAVIVITIYALLFGAVAVWRKSLRPGMIGHAWFDMLAPLVH